MILEKRSKSLSEAGKTRKAAENAEKNAANTPVKCKKSFLSIFYVTKDEKSIFFT